MNKLMNPQLFNKPDEIAWMLLSLMGVSIEEQLRLIGGLPKKRVSKSPYITNSVLLRCSLRYINCLRDYFDFFYEENTDIPSTLYIEFKSAISELTNEDCLTEKDFYNSKWEHVRKVCDRILIETGLPKIEFTEKINFARLVRVFINENGQIQED